MKQEVGLAVTLYFITLKCILWLFPQTTLDQVPFCLPLTTILIEKSNIGTEEKKLPTKVIIQLLIILLITYSLEKWFTLVSYFLVLVTVCFTYCINPPHSFLLISGFNIPPNLNWETEPTLSP